MSGRLRQVNADTAGKNGVPGRGSRRAAARRGRIPATRWSLSGRR